MILMSETAGAVDPVLLAAGAQARSALEEITAAETIGSATGHEVHEERVITLLFESSLRGYPGWRWAATVTRVDDESPVNVLEVGLLPGPDSVVSPEWVPWSERLAQYKEAQAQQAADDPSGDAHTDDIGADDTDADDADADAEDELLDNDFSDFDTEIDGVDLEGEGDNTDEDPSADEDTHS